MNGNGFVIAGDGWVQVTPCGEYPHKGAGVTQVIDREACDKMVADFNARKVADNFPGVLVDFDHFSLDTDKPSEAAGWISELEARDDGLWARVRWSDAGLSAVTGGRYRLLSPVFRHPGGTEDLGSGRVRPVSLESVALTNEPNIRGGKPIANRGTVGNRQSAVSNREETLNAQLPTLNSQRGEGEAPDGATTNGDTNAEHSTSNVEHRTAVENRETAGEGPGGKAGNGPVGKQKPGDGMGNRWSDEARAVSLAVRRIKAAERQKAMDLAAKVRGEVGKGAEGRGRKTEGGGRQRTAVADLRPPASDRRIFIAVRQDKARVRQAAEDVRLTMAKRRKAGVAGKG